MADEQNADLVQLLMESQTLGTTVSVLEADIARVRGQRMTIAKTIFERYGKGPHDIGGEPFVVVVRTSKEGSDGYFLQRKLLPKQKTQLTA